MDRPGGADERESLWERTRLFEQALGLEHPWYVEKADFDPKTRKLDLHLNFEAGGLFECGGCGGEGCKAYDTARRRWPHLNFFQHEAFLHAPVPRVKCPSCGIRRAQVPWARPRSGFTLLFEALVVTMAAQMPVRAVGRIVGEHDTRLWRIVKRHMDEARAAADHGGVEAVGRATTFARIRSGAAGPRSANWSPCMLRSTRSFGWRCRNCVT